jgi:hypothetical protein
MAGEGRLSPPKAATVSAVPTLLVFKGGAVVYSMVGYQDKRRLLEALKAALDGHAAYQAPQEDALHQTGHAIDALPTSAYPPA